MNKFGLLEDENPQVDQPQTMTEKLAMFPPVKPRSPLNLAAVDAAAAPHGFISREAAPPLETRHRRRRAMPSEPTRHLAIRLTTTQYDRFVEYADRHRLTYHEALAQLMDQAQD